MVALLSQLGNRSAPLDHLPQALDDRFAEDYSFCAPPRSPSLRRPAVAAAYRAKATYRGQGSPGAGGERRGRG